MADVSSFLRHHDAGGLVAALERNGVNGEDLVAFANVAEVVRELHLTPFAARKVLRLRDEFLLGGAPV